MDTSDSTVSRLLGFWKIVSWTREVVATGEVSDVLGPAPVGYLAYHPDGKMMVAVFGRSRLKETGALLKTEEKAELFDTMLAYVAAYTLEEDRVIHHVEAAWNPNWEIDLSRPFRLEGDRLVVSGAPNVDPLTGEDVHYRVEFTRV